MKQQDIMSDFRIEAREQLRKAFDMYAITEVDYRHVEIRLDIRGTTAGYAGRRGNHYYMRFNPEAIEKHWDDMVKDTIPHEIAHIITYIRADLRDIPLRNGKRNPHGPRWKAICRALGGDDSRTHSMALTAAKRKFRHEYNVNGTIYKIGPKHHKAIQMGRPIKIRATGEQVLRSMYVRKVQIGGPVAPPRQAAQNPVPTPSPSRTIAKPSTGSKMDVARRIMVENPGKSRAEIIALFMSQAGLSKAGASTYYQKLK